MCTLFVVNCDKYVTQVRYGHLCYKSDIGDSWVVVCRRGVIIMGRPTIPKFSEIFFWCIVLQREGPSPPWPPCVIYATPVTLLPHTCQHLLYKCHTWVFITLPIRIFITLPIWYQREAFCNIRISLYSNVWICYTFTNLHTYRSGRLK